tara:strand:+ start:332 stop:556 length:225 start_codon:yes stop_codon:yes gene_type:complete
MIKLKKLLESKNLKEDVLDKKVRSISKGVVGAVKIDMEHIEESVEEDGVLEALDHLKNAMDRLKNLEKLLKKKA